MRKRHLVWIAFLASVLLGAGCAQVLGFYDDYHDADAGQGGGGSPPSVCKDDSQCDDHNPCTTDTCSPDKTCVSTPLDGVPAPDAAQTAGDCKTIQCVDGKPHDVAQDDDTPDDDESCTIDSCADTIPSHVAEKEGTICQDSLGDNGRCDAQGNCTVICTTDKECMPPGPCLSASCDTSQGVCVFANLPDNMPTPGAPVIPGDCKVTVCVDGQSQDVADDTDLPTVGDCLIAGCDQGTPAPQLKPMHTGCASFNINQPGYCDGSGTCQQCTQDSDCASTSPTTDCQKPVCNNFKCQPEFTPVNMPTTAQMAGDCQKSICDGMGNAIQIADNNDPSSDGNECTLDQCAGASTTNHPNAPDMITKCGTGMALACFGGQCVGCTMDNQCAPASCSGTVLNKAQTCNLGNGKCATPTPQDCAPYNCVAALNACPTKCSADTDCINGYYCTGTNGTCQQKAPQGGTCGSDHQCTTSHCVDGFCCNTACTNGCDACSNAKTGAANGTCSHVTIGTDPNNVCSDQGAASCGTNGACDGLGACQKYVSGTVCVAASCSGNTLIKQKTCNGSGTCMTFGSQICTPYLCMAANNACPSTCNADTDCFTSYYCTGPNGSCQPKVGQGGTCSTDHQCASSHCVDGVCCDTACNTACQACTVAKKQFASNNGTCGPAKNGQADPRGICATTPQSSCGTDGLCNGGTCENWPSTTSCQAGSCMGNTQTTAKTCNGNGACSQGGTTSACANGLLCNAAAMMCFASCGNGAAADDSKCVGGDYCDPQSGTCKIKIATGSAGCVADSQCQSGICGLNNGVCCNALCPDEGAGTCGKSAECAPATGACLFYNGSCSAFVCPAGGNSYTTYSVCSNGSCSGGGINGICGNSLMCNASGTACLTACGTANLAGDANCTSGYYCDGMNGGACQPKKGPNVGCFRDAECSNGMCQGSGKCN
ncbi:MAG: hypothetical protein QM820_60870 [Minicystis sp.]